MFRLYDWECSRCGTAHERVIELPQGSAPPARKRLDCASCENKTMHARRIAKPAQYLYDRPMSPHVAGGKFDTLGHARLPRLPQPPKDLNPRDVGDFYLSSEFQKRKAERIAARKLNEAKRKRAAAGVDFRANPLPGDPKWRGA